MADQNTRGNQPGSEGGDGGAGSGARRNPADNLSHEDRVRGGERSAAMQQRDASGQFAGRKKDSGGHTQNTARGPQGQMGGGAGRNAGNTGNA